MAIHRSRSSEIRGLLPLLILCGGMTLATEKAVAKNSQTKQKQFISVAKSPRKKSSLKSSKSKKSKTSLPIAKSQPVSGAKANLKHKSTFRGPYSLAVSQSLGEILNCDSDYYTTADAPGLGEGDESSAKISYPSAIPTEGYMTSGYGRRRSPFHDRIVHHRGVDYGVPRGSPIYATADGIVVFAGWRGSFGKTVIVDHGNGVMTVYAHASRLSVKVGDTITRGAVVGKVGSTGRSTGPHLHYEIWVNGRATNPLHFQRSAEAKVLLVNARD